MGYVGSAYLNSDISDETASIRKSCPREDAEGKVFTQKEQQDEGFRGEELACFSLQIEGVAVDNI